MSEKANGQFERMVEIATESVAKKGWERATQKEITMAAYGMLSRQIRCRMQGITKPFWWMAGVITASAIWYGISQVLGL